MPLCFLDLIPTTPLKKIASVCKAFIVRKFPVFLATSTKADYLAPAPVVSVGSAIAFSTPTTYTSVRLYPHPAILGLSNRPFNKNFGVFLEL